MTASDANWWKRRWSVWQYHCNYKISELEPKMVKYCCRLKISSGWWCFMFKILKQESFCWIKRKVHIKTLTSSSIFKVNCIFKLAKIRQFTWERLQYISTEVQILWTLQSQKNMNKIQDTVCLGYEVNVATFKQWSKDVLKGLGAEQWSNMWWCMYLSQRFLALPQWVNMLN